MPKGDQTQPGGSIPASDSAAGGLPKTDPATEGRAKEEANQTQPGAECVILAGPVELNGNPPEAGAAAGGETRIAGKRNAVDGTVERGQDGEGAPDSGKGTGSSEKETVDSGNGNTVDSGNGISDAGDGIRDSGKGATVSGTETGDSGAETKDSEKDTDLTMKETENPGETDGESETSDGGYGYEQSMSFDALAALPREEAGAATVLSAGGKRLMKKGKLSSGGPLWSCSDYYVNEEDLHAVLKTDDFSLKYQVEFHTSVDLEPGDVEIRIPELLLCNRRGEGIVPSQIGVPRGTKDAPANSLNSPFNWNRDDQGMLVFFNFRKITAGTNTAFQVLYHPVLIFDLIDGAAWSITPQISVRMPDGTIQENPVDELTGSIDSYAAILGASADAYSDGSISCLPALYTQDQVRRVLGDSLPPFLSSQADRLVFIAWKVDSQGRFNQPWSLRMDAALSGEGLSGDGGLCVVGSVTRAAKDAEGSGQGNIVKYQAGEENSTCIVQLSTEDLSQFVKQGMFHLTTIVVTAVRRDALQRNGSVLGMNADLSLTPADGMDPDSAAGACASWTFVDYQWKYKGDDVGIRAWTGKMAPDGTVSYPGKEETMSGWINEYRLSRETGSGAGEIPLRIRSECRGYSFTHELQGPAAGSYREGSGYEVTTVDDVVYLASQSQGNGALQLLGPQDYCYSGVRVTIRDRGMDLFEDQVCAPMTEAECPGADRSTHIYAMYEGSADWELAAECPWNSSGKIVYTFSEEQIRKKIWRVKAVHCCVDYDSSCTIDCSLCIRPESPAAGALLENGESGSLTAWNLEHLGSVLARSTGTSSDGWFHDTRETVYDNYSEPGLGELTRSLYGVPSMRANSFARLTELAKHARALKTAARDNDPENGRVCLTYTIGAVEGYQVYSRQAARRIAREAASLPVPDRAQYVVYDLLPEGVIFDPSAGIKAGLVMGDTDRQLVTPSLWKSKDVSVRIDPSGGIRKNWRNTGRTLVVLQVSIALGSEQIPRMDQGMWMNGIGVQFGCTCPYRDLESMNSMPNIAAVMPGEGLGDPACQILGTDDEVACDDGTVVPYAGAEKDALEAFGPDIDEDGVTNLRTVLYALALSPGDTAVSLTDGIDLTVKADREDFTDGGKSAVIGPEDCYTYRIDVANPSARPISDLVVCSHLERGKEERERAEPGRSFDAASWQGFLEEIDTEALERRKIAPVIWVSEDEDAPFPGQGEQTDSVLTTNHGWIRIEDWNKDLGFVHSVAVDLRKMTDGNDFILDAGDSIHLFLHMKGPGIGEGEGQTTAQHAYQCASFYSISEEEPDGDLVQCNAVEVTLKEKSTLIVEKVLTNPSEDGDVRQPFLFCLTRNGTPAALCRYRLEEKQGDASLQQQVWQADDMLHTTNQDGLFFLCSGQRAVFENEPGREELEVEEILSADYEVSRQQEDTPAGSVCRFENTWYPPLYLTKKVLGIPEGTSLPDDVFRVRVTMEGNSMAGKPYWTVDPDQGMVENQIVEAHIVDEDSCVLLHAGEVIAMHPQGGECRFEVQEEESCINAQSNYAGVTTFAGGTLGEEGASVTIENAWRWKELVLHKEVLHRDAMLCLEPFTFRLWKVREGEDAASFDMDHPEAIADPAAGVEGSMEDTTFVTDENGSFTLACAGKDVILKHLEALRTYVIQETDLPEDYEAVNQGIAAVSMPLLGSRRYVTIRNSWKRRSLRVSKTVLSGTHKNRTTVCSPGYPGLFQAGSGNVSLFSCAPEGMSGFTVAFPARIRLNGEEAISVIVDHHVVDAFQGVIEAGTVKTYPGYTNVSLEFGNMTGQQKEGFFFFFSPMFGEEDDQGEESEKTFSFLLEIADAEGNLAPAVEAGFQVSDGEEGKTDETGHFSLAAGKSAIFRDIAKDGCAWRVTEEPDPSCPQAYPADGQPQSGILGEDGTDLSQALFINGQTCQGMFRKQFTAKPEDAAAAGYVQQERAKGTASALRSSFLIEIQGAHGSFAPLEGMVEIADASEGSLLRCEVPDGIVCVGENQTVVLSGIAPGRQWRVTELESGLVSKDSVIYGTVCCVPGSGRQMSGTAAGQVFDLCFTNEVHSVSAHEDSMIRKAFLSGEKGWEKVPDGAVLALCLERYAQGAWHAAAGVDWIQCQGTLPEGAAFHQTGEDGMIRVRKETREGTSDSPGQYILPIAIGTGKVRTTLYYTEHEAQEGDLRIREVLDLSDPSYGMLVRCEGNTFVNENDLQTVVVEKQTDIETDELFRFRITQTIDQAAMPGSYLRYQIRDAVSGTETGQGSSDAQGIFTLKSGSQAVFRLPQGTKWTVTELNNGNWRLESCRMENALTDPVQVQNGMSFAVACVRHNVTLTSELLRESLSDPLTGRTLDFTNPQLRIPHYVRRGDEILEITGIGAQAFSKTSIQSVELEDGIRTIGTQAFFRCGYLTQVRLPETLEEFGDRCFGMTAISSLDIPASVRKTGQGIVAVCKSLRQITVHQNEAQSPFSGYHWDTRTQTSVTFTG